jgi:hypothetical protein
MIFDIDFLVKNLIHFKLHKIILYTELTIHFLTSDTRVKIVMLNSPVGLTGS